MKVSNSNWVAFLGIITLFTSALISNTIANGIDKFSSDDLDEDDFIEFEEGGIDNEVDIDKRDTDDEEEMDELETEQLLSDDPKLISNRLPI